MRVDDIKESHIIISENWTNHKDVRIIVFYGSRCDINAIDSSIDPLLAGEVKKGVLPLLLEFIFQGDIF